MFARIRKTVAGFLFTVRNSSARKRNIHLILERLEDRLVPVDRIVFLGGDAPNAANTLRDVIMNQAVNGDRILFDPALAGQTIDLGSEIPIANKNLIIDGSLNGNGQSQNITISGNGNNRIFDFTGNNSNQTINSLIFTEGSDAAAPAALGGGAIYVEGALTLNNDSFDDNSATGQGGAVRVQGSLTLNNVFFSQNVSQLGGGAVAVSANDNTDFLSVTNNSTFSGNSTTSGSGPGAGGG